MHLSNGIDELGTVPIDPFTKWPMPIMVDLLVSPSANARRLLPLHGLATWPRLCCHDWQLNSSLGHGM